MATASEYESRIEQLGWSGLRELWDRIDSRDTPGWEAGKAFEYLVLRAFQLDRATVRWPYSVTIDEDEVEQIDGAVHAGGLSCLVESKDLTGRLQIGPIAKMRNQLMRRPSGAIGLIFSRSGFTPPALLLSRYVAPQTILLWTGDEVSYCLGQQSVVPWLLSKYRACVELGIPDGNILGGGLP